MKYSILFKLRICKEPYRNSIAGLVHGCVGGRSFDVINKLIEPALADLLGLVQVLARCLLILRDTVTTTRILRVAETPLLEEIQLTS